MTTQKTKSRSNQKNKYKPKFASNPLLVLEDSIGFSGDLIKIKTTKKKEMIKEIKTNLEMWLNNPHFNHFKKEKLDMAIVIFTDKFRNKKQDVDNMAKIVLDALKKSKNQNDPYLVDDDSQITRLLIYKLKTKDMEGYETDTLIVSFRIHNPNKQMILKEEREI